MTELEYLLQEKRVLINLVENNFEKIMNNQIIKPEYLLKFGFMIKSADGDLMTYHSDFLTVNYELSLNLANPSFVGVHKDDHKRTYKFHINSIEDFDELMDLLNLY